MFILSSLLSSPCRHSAAAASTGMYLFGGYDKAKNKFFSELSYLDFSSKEWYSPPIAGGEVDEKKGKGKEKDDESVGPSPRYNHACAWDPLSCSIFISGGKGI